RLHGLDDLVGYHLNLAYRLQLRRFASIAPRIRHPRPSVRDTEARLLQSRPQADRPREGAGQETREPGDGTRRARASGPPFPPARHDRPAPPGAPPDETRREADARARGAIRRAESRPARTVGRPRARRAA